MATDETAGMRLRDLRKASGLTQRELALLLGVTETALRSWEAGRYEPSRRHQRAIAKRFGVEVDELTFG